MLTTKRKPHLTLVIAALTASGVVAAALFSFPLVHSPPARVAPPSLQNLYVIYYGHLVNPDGSITEQASRIVEAKPSLVIVPYSFPDGEPNLTAKVHQKFKDAGIKVLTYIWTKYGDRSIGDVKADIDSQLSAGVDGIFVDEVTNIMTDNEFVYYSLIYNYVKSHDKDALVVMNPGHYKVSEKIMQMSDIVSLEEEWVYHDQIVWMKNYSPTRFMGVSSNEYCNQCITESNAASKTLEAWSSGIGYHFSTDRYIDLPGWFSGYASQVKDIKQPSAASSVSPLSGGGRR